MSSLTGYTVVQRRRGCICGNRIEAWRFATSAFARSGAAVFRFRRGCPPILVRPVLLTQTGAVLQPERGVLRPIAPVPGRNAPVLGPIAPVFGSNFGFLPEPCRGALPSLARERKRRWRRAEFHRKRCKAHGVSPARSVAEDSQVARCVSPARSAARQFRASALRRNFERQPPDA